MALQNHGDNDKIVKAGDDTVTVTIPRRWWKFLKYAMNLKPGSHIGNIIVDSNECYGTFQHIGKCQHWK